MNFDIMCGAMKPMNYFTAVAIALNAIFAAKASGANAFSVDMLDGEKWWGCQFL